MLIADAFESAEANIKEAAIVTVESGWCNGVRGVQRDLRFSSDPQDPKLNPELNPKLNPKLHPEMMLSRLKIPSQIWSSQNRDFDPHHN